MSDSDKLQPALNDANYPTLSEARTWRGRVLAGIGAAALSVGTSACIPFATSGDPADWEEPPAKKADAGDAGHEVPPLGGAPMLEEPDAGEIEPPLGGVPPLEDPPLGGEPQP